MNKLRCTYELYSFSFKDVRKKNKSNFRAALQLLSLYQCWLFTYIFIDYDTRKKRKCETSINLSLSLFLQLNFIYFREAFNLLNIFALAEIQF